MERSGIEARPAASKHSDGGQARLSTSCYATALGLILYVFCDKLFTPHAEIVSGKCSRSNKWIVIMDKGAHFFRTDLQVHTPRDINWKGPDRVDHEERKAYADMLIQACRDKGLDAIAITDHHDMTFVPYVRQAAEEETDDAGNALSDEKRIVVFPGMELTLGVPCQALLIFDSDLPDDMFSLAMSALTIKPNADTEAKTAAVARLDHIQSLKSLKEELDKHQYLRDRYIILPNVSEGKFSLLRTGQAGKYTEMPCVGGYVDGDIGKLGDGNRNILAGKTKEWGNKRVACFQTSDNRGEDHGLLGEHATWIKWAAPTAEALRQACLAQESRVSHEQPRLPSISIDGIHVNNSVFLGPIDLDLNPQYNALIGGRGTGKSTILEYLRWALCDQPPGLEEEDSPNYQRRRTRLIEQTLKPLNGTVQVRFVVNGVPHMVRRSSEDGSLQIKVADDEMRACTEEEIRGLLPIQAYSQKQLSDVSVRIDELSRFIATPIRSELGQLDRQLSEKAERIRQTYTSRQRQRTLEKILHERDLEASSLQQQADSIRNSLTGLSEADRNLLNQGPSYEAADQIIDGWLSHVRVLSEEVDELSQRLEQSRAEAEQAPREPEDVNRILQAAYDEHQALLEHARDTLGTLKQRANNVIQASEDPNSDTPWGQWTKRISDFRTEYNAAVQRSSAHKERMEQLQDIEGRLSAHRRETARLREELQSLGPADESYQGERTAWHDLIAQRDDLIDTQCQRLTERSDGAIRARVQRFADASDFLKRLRDAVSGSGVRGEKYEHVAESITEVEDPKQHLETLLTQLELLAEHDADKDGLDHLPETPALSAVGLTAGDLQRITQRLTTDDWLSVSLTPIESIPVFEFRSREGEYIPFKNASAGQQATALLKTLLNQPGPPLIIDQPEEDLDNPVVLEIVEQVWQAKNGRQLIFASHNANLVVNGDAELVAWCDYRTAGDQSGGKIAGEGAIDIPAVRDAIKSIMEGGEEAFTLRKEKYGF